MAFAYEHRANAKRSRMPHVHMLFVRVKTVGFAHGLSSTWLLSGASGMPTMYLCLFLKFFRDGEQAIS